MRGKSLIRLKDAREHTQQTQDRAVPSSSAPSPVAVGWEEEGQGGIWGALAACWPTGQEHPPLALTTVIYLVLLPAGASQLERENQRTRELIHKGASSLLGVGVGARWAGGDPGTLVSSSVE